MALLEVKQQSGISTFNRLVDCTNLLTTLGFQNIEFDLCDITCTFSNSIISNIPVLIKNAGSTDCVLVHIGNSRNGITRVFNCYLCAVMFLYVFYKKV